MTQAKRNRRARIEAIGGGVIWVLLTIGVQFLAR